METNEVMEVEAIEVETDLVPCEEMPVVAESSGLSTLGSVALGLGAVVGVGTLIVKGSQRAYVKTCSKKGVPINTRERWYQLWRPKAKKVKVPDTFQAENVSSEDVSDDWTKEE